jgi:Asp-tRNA(Asn)/Glu-tRNA(Gln) amidotransferase A subunit family amidase
MTAKPLYSLTATEARDLIKGRSIDAEDLVKSCLWRIESREPNVAAWAYLNADDATSTARAQDRSHVSGGLLQGIPVAFKDVINTSDCPTSYGSHLYRRHQPAEDAVCVAMSRAAGGIVLGKTVSTEFAYLYPGITSHPDNRQHSPGGSSSGSAAAVADYMVPLAVGTQTIGSLIRPAAYCGIYALKPTFGAFNYAGALHLSESLDTLGCMARSLSDIALFRSALIGIEHRPIPESAKVPRIAVYRSSCWNQAEPQARHVIEQVAEDLARAGATITDFDFSDDLQVCLNETTAVLKFEAARVLGTLRDDQPAGVSGAVRQLVDDGRAITLDAYKDAQRGLARMRDRLGDALAKVDAVLSLPAPGEAPLGLSSTGPGLFNFLWTAAHVPAMTMPVTRGEKGLPLGIQLAAGWHEDDKLLATADWVGKHIRADFSRPY